MSFHKYLVIVVFALCIGIFLTTQSEKYMRQVQTDLPLSQGQTCLIPEGCGDSYAIVENVRGWPIPFMRSSDEGGAGQLIILAFILDVTIFSSLILLIFFVATKLTKSKKSKNIFS